MILTGPEIIRRMYDTGNIAISPFNPSRMNPNSYNLTLHPDLFLVEPQLYARKDGTLFSGLDMKKETTLSKITIPEDGFILRKGRLYLGRTNEYTITQNLVPMIEGRSSVGRLGVFIHVTAGFGDDGFKGFWTLEIMTVEDILIYPDVEICQIFYHTVEGERKPYNSGKYQNNTGVQGSLLYKELT